MFVAICDDELKAIQHYGAEVSRICAENDIAVKIGEYGTGKQLLFAISGQSDPPDIVLLDIGMPKIDGIEVAAKMRETGYKGVIVFVTMKDNRMLDAFDVDASNYVVKGAADEQDRFERAFLRAVERTRERKARHLLCNGISEHRNIPIDSIKYFSINRHVCTVHYGDGETFDFISTLRRLEDMLGEFGFVRIQRSYTVNCAHVTSFSYRTCELDDGTKLSVGRGNASKLREEMEHWAHVVIGGGSRGES